MNESTNRFIYVTAQRLAECQVDCRDIRDGIGFSNADYSLAFTLIANRETEALARMLLVYRDQAGLSDNKELLAEIAQIAGVDATDSKSVRTSLKSYRDLYRGQLSWIFDGTNFVFGGYKPSEKLQTLLNFLGTNTDDRVWTVTIDRIKEFLPAFCAATSIITGTGARKLTRSATLCSLLGVHSDAILKDPMAKGLAFWTPFDTMSDRAGVCVNVVWEARMGFRQSLRRKGQRLGKVSTRMFETRRNTAAMRQLACYMAAFPGVIDNIEQMFDHLFPGYGRTALNADVILTTSFLGSRAQIAVTNRRSPKAEHIAAIAKSMGISTTKSGLHSVTTQEAPAFIDRVLLELGINVLLCPVTARLSKPVGTGRAAAVDYTRAA